MKILKIMKDGGPLSKVWGMFLIEIKSAFSVVLLRFSDGSREAYHTHAFNAVSWVLRGKLIENNLGGDRKVYTPSWFPIHTPRNCFHMVVSEGTTWVLSFRGPWVAEWKEYLPDENIIITLTHGRQVVDRT